MTWWGFFGMYADHIDQIWRKSDDPLQCDPYHWQLDWLLKIIFQLTRLSVCPNDCLDVLPYVHSAQKNQCHLFKGYSKKTAKWLILGGVQFSTDVAVTQNGIYSSIRISAFFIYNLISVRLFLKIYQILFMKIHDEKLCILENI